MRTPLVLASGMRSAPSLLCAALEPGPHRRIRERDRRGASRTPRVLGATCDLTCADPPAASSPVTLEQLCQTRLSLCLELQPVTSGPTSQLNPELDHRASGCVYEGKDPFSWQARRTEVCRGHLLLYRSLWAKESPDWRQLKMGLDHRPAQVRDVCSVCFLLHSRISCSF